MTSGAIMLENILFIDAFLARLVAVQRVWTFSGIEDLGFLMVFVYLENILG